MQFVSGHLYFIKDSFFEYVDDPNLMINYQNSSRPHYYAFGIEKPIYIG